jgi:hypothetical protein
MSAERRLLFATSWVSRSTEDDVTNFRLEVGIAIFYFNLDFDTPPNSDPPVLPALSAQKQGNSRGDVLMTSSSRWL